MTPRWVQDRTKDFERTIVANFTRLLGNCAHCGSGVAGHDLALLASAPIDEKTDQETLLRLFEATKEHRWAHLLEFKEWRGACDDLEVHALRCSDGRLTVFILRSYFELSKGGDDLLYREELAEEEAGRLTAAFPSIEWRRL